MSQFIFGLSHEFQTSFWSFIPIKVLYFFWDCASFDTYLLWVLISKQEWGIRVSFIIVELVGGSYYFHQLFVHWDALIETTKTPCELWKEWSPFYKCFKCGGVWWRWWFLFLKDKEPLIVFSLGYGHNSST